MIEALARRPMALCCASMIASITASITASMIGCSGAPEERIVPRAEEPAAVVSEEAAEAEPALDGEAACASALRESTPEALRDALTGLGWTTVYDDACAARAARTAEDPEACDALSVRSLREHCRDRVAIETGRPLSCHGDDEGHDPLCIALASTQPGMCRAVPLAHRALCEALLGDGVDRCGRRDVPDTAGCRARFEELSSHVPAPSSARGVSPHVSLRTTRVVDAGAHERREEPVEEDLSSTERGAVLRWEGCEGVLLLGDPYPEPLARRTRRYVEVRLPRAWNEALSVPLGASSARVQVERTTFGRAEASAVAGGSGTIDVEPFPIELGAPIHVTVRGRLVRSPGYVEVNLDVRTLLRDIVGERPERCTASADDEEPVDGEP